MTEPMPPSSPAPARQRATVDIITRQLSDDIVAGRLIPGFRLDETRLAARFGVSRTPVREALRQLEATGLVEKRPHWGVVVRSIDSERLAHMFEAMAELEANCARLCALRMTAEQRVQLERLHRETVPKVVSGDLDGYEVANLAFHSLIYRGTNNPEMVQLCQDYRRRLAPFRRNQFRVLGRLAHSLDEHDKIVSAILRADGDQAADLMRAHILTVREASDEFLLSAQSG